MVPSVGLTIARSSADRAFTVGGLVRLLRLGGLVAGRRMRPRPWRSSSIWRGERPRWLSGALRPLERFTGIATGEAVHRRSARRGQHVEPLTVPSLGRR
jgi:hypothetical protein